MSEKLTEAEMRLFCLGAALYGRDTRASRIIADVLDERHAAKKKKSTQRRRKK